MIDFVRSIREKYGKFLQVMDNASCRKSRALVREIETYGGDIRLEYLPAYSRDLNPVEMVWKKFKKYIANGIYQRVNDMTKAIDAMLRDGTVAPPSLPGYALRAVKSAATA